MIIQSKRPLQWGVDAIFFVEMKIIYSKFPAGDWFWTG